MSPSHCSRKGRPLLTFTADEVAGLTGPDWLRRRRSDAYDALTSMPLPRESEEVWRYSPIDSLDLDAYRPLTGDVPAGDGPAAAVELSTLPRRSGLAVVRNGRPLSVDRGGLPASVLFGDAAEGTEGRELLGSVLQGGDAMVRLNDAFHPGAIVIDVPAGVVVADPIVIAHWCDGTAAASGATATFPRTVVRLGAGAQASVVEVVAGAAEGTRSLVVPVSELAVGDAANLVYVSMQVLGTGAWHLARVAGTVGRDASLRAFTLGLGGAYDRIRADVEITGQGGSSELKSVYLGTGEQIHDLRTMQDHAAPRTTSDLLSKGAVAGTSRSIYTGLIRVRRGAVKTNAMQNNQNLVLDESAHADSVPNLDIEENDVRCSHASTVGPVDEDQRYYLESRGVPPERAERLIVLGFFDDIVDRSPEPTAIEALRRQVGSRLAGAVGDGTPS